LESVSAIAAFKGMRARRKKSAESVENFSLTPEENSLAVMTQTIQKEAALI
jgi:hypothetical protein